MYQKSEDGYVKEYVNFEGNCIYLLGIFKLSNDCSPTKIANKYNLKTITEQNTQWQLWPFMRVQKTVITGIPKDKK